MKKKGVSEIVAILLLIMIIIIAVVVIGFFTLNYLRGTEETSELRNQVNNANMRIIDVEFDASDPLTFSITFYSGPGMQELISESEEEVSKTYYILTEKIETEINEETEIILPDVSIVNVGDVSRSMYTSDKIIELKEASKSFISGVLAENPKNEFGLVAYSTDVVEEYCHVLSKDETSLIAEVDTWQVVEYTCICCGVNKAIEYFQSADPENDKVMVVMTDGVANYECSPHDANSPEAKNDAIVAAADANAQGITVYTIGFGGSAVDTDTLQQMADLGGGKYYPAAVSQLEEIYEEIQNEISEPVERITYQEEEKTMYETVEVVVYAPKDTYYLKIVFHTDDNTYTKDQVISGLPGPIETKQVDISLEPDWGITTEDVIKIAIYAATETEDGKEVLSDTPIAVWEKPGEH